MGTKTEMEEFIHEVPQNTGEKRIHEELLQLIIKRQKYQSKTGKGI
jgi:hypothetical protein